MKNRMHPDKPETKISHPPHRADRWLTELPTRTALADHRWLKPTVHHVLDPKLWRMHHEPVARGAAIGAFWAFVLPTGQIQVAVANSAWWRGNIPIAAGMTLISNPFTMGFWLWLAHQAGSSALDAPPPLPLRQLGESKGIFDYLCAIGEQAILGMGMFAVGGALAAYALVKIVWGLQFWLLIRPCEVLSPRSG